MICGIYARESMKDRKSMDSTETIEHQISLIKEHGKRMFGKKAIFDDAYIYVDKESAYKTTMLQRQAMKNLLEDIDILDVVFFKGISRFSRDSAESIATAKTLAQKGIRVISIEENYDSFQNDPTFFQLYSVLAEFESRKTAIRVALGMKEKAKNGIFNNSQPSFGYCRIHEIPDAELKEKLISSGCHPQQLYPINHLKPIVKEIFQMYLDGLGYTKIANNLNGRGIRTSHNNLFYPNGIRRILTNPVYTGSIVYGKKRYEYIDELDRSKKKCQTVFTSPDDWVICEHAHEGIIDKDIFEEVQKRINEHHDIYKKRKTPNAQHPLTGLIKCPTCGAPMTCQKKTKKLATTGKVKVYFYYNCSKPTPEGKVCKQKNINAIDLEMHIYNAIREQILQVKDEVALFQNYSINSQESAIKQSILEVDRLIEKNIKNSRSLLENKELYDELTFRSINKEYRLEMTNLQKQKEELQNELSFSKDILTEDDLQKEFENFLNVNISDRTRLKELFHGWINEIKINDGELLIDQKFKLPNKNETP